MDGETVGYVVVLGVLPAIGLCAVAVAYLSARARRRRADAFRAFAADTGLQLLPDDPPDDQTSYVNFYPLGRWRSANENVVRGRRGGIDWDLFDYSLGHAMQRHGYGVVAARVPRMSLPRVRLRPEQLADRLLDAVGLRDVRTGSDAFDRRYRLSGGDDDAVRRVFHRDLVQYLLTLPDDRWMMEGDTVIILRRTRFAPAELPAVMSAIEGFAARVPPEFMDAKARAAGEGAAEGRVVDSAGSTTKGQRA